MRIRDIISEDPTPVPRKLPRQPTGADVQALRDPELINAVATVAADANSHEDAEALAGQISAREQEQDRRAGQQQPWANLVQSAGEDPTSARKFNDIVGQAQRQQQIQQQRQQAQAQAPAGAPRPPVYGQGSASAIKPTKPTPPGG
jgi:hypothetical protein